MAAYDRGNSLPPEQLLDVAVRQLTKVDAQNNMQSIAHVYVVERGDPASFEQKLLRRQFANHIGASLYAMWTRKSQTRRPICFAERLKALPGSRGILHDLNQANEPQVIPAQRLIDPTSET